MIENPSDPPGSSLHRPLAYGVGKHPESVRSERFRYRFDRLFYFTAFDRIGNQVQELVQGFA